MNVAAENATRTHDSPSPLRLQRSQRIGFFGTLGMLAFTSAFIVHTFIAHPRSDELLKRPKKRAWVKSLIHRINLDMSLYFYKTIYQ